MRAWRRINPVGRFTVGIVLLLPLFFALWYLMSPLLVWLLALAVDALLPVLLPDTIAGVAAAGSALDIVTLLPLNADLRAQLPADTTGELVFRLNPLVYAYNLPLFTTLAIAVPGEERAIWRRWLWGLPWLFAAQVWGVGFDVLKTLLFGLGPGVAAELAFAGWQVELVALGYQLGFLILPSVLPIAVWFVLYRDYLYQLVRARPPAPT